MRKLIAVLGLTAMTMIGFSNNLDACQATHKCSGGETITCNGNKRCSSGPGYVNCYNSDGSFSSSSCDAIP